MHLKFHQLAVGQRFRFDGVEWVKVGPLIVQNGDGKQRLMPRSAKVEPILDEEPAGLRSRTPDRIPRDAVERRLAKVVACVEALFVEIEQGQIDVSTARERIRACHAETLSDLDPPAV